MENHVESSDQEIANKLSENGESNDLNMHNSDIPLTPLLLLENDENEPPIDSSVVDSGHPSQRFVDLDEEEEVNQKIADDALRKHLADDCEDEDSRRCLLCGYHGDDNIEGRLLYTGSDTWVHVNCALWCNDVYEEDSGELIVCHHTTMNQRLCEALYSLRKSSKTNRDKKFSRRESWDQSSDEELSPDTINPADFADHPAFTSIEETIADDLEPISLGDLLVCRRVFVPSDCFAASVYPRSINTDIIQDVFLMDDDEHSDLMRAAKEAVSALAVSPNSFAFLQNNGLSANSLVITIGSLRVDRLGEVREASDSTKCYHTEQLFVSYTLSCTENLLELVKTRFSCPVYSSCEAKSSTHTSSGYIEANPTSRLSPIVITNSSKSISLSKMPVVNATNLTRSHNTPRLVNVDSRIRLLAPASTNKSSPYFYASSTLTHNNLVGSSNNYGVKSNNMTLSTVQESSKTLTAVLTGAPPIISSSTILLSEYEPPVLLSRPVVHNNTVTCYSTIPVSGFQIVTSSINNPVSQRQMIQSSTLTPHNPSLKIINTAAPSSTQLRVNSVNMVPIKQQLQPQQNHLLQLQQLQQNKLQVNACTGRTLLLPNLYQPNIIPVNNLTMPNTIIPVQQNGLSCPIGTMNPFPVNMNTNKSVTLSHGGPNGTTVIRIQNVHSSQKGGGLLTSPTKDVQLATHLDGLFHNVSMATSPNKRGATSTTNSLSQTGRRLLPQLDGTGDDDDGPNYGSDPIRRCSYKTRSSSSLSSSNSLSHRTAASGRSKSHFPSNRLAKNELLCKANKKTRTTNKSVSPKPEGKRRWIEDRIRQQELAHLVLKAKQASHARLYQNEVEKHVRSFRLTFSIDGVVRSTSSPIAAWRSVIMRVSSLREKHGLKPLICTAIDGWSQFGLNHRYLIFLIEQMRGAFHCYRYRFQYHWQKIDRLRQKFTPPVPCSEGCARAVPWEKPRLPRNHARDSLAFLRCKANPPPRPLVSSSEGNVLPYQDPCLVNTNEPTKLLSPNEQATCREAARQAAMLVATQLKLPQRLRLACVAKAVLRATGIPMQLTPQKSVTRDEPSNSTDQVFGLTYSDDEDSSDLSNYEVDDEKEGDEDDFGTVANQFGRLLSGPLARFYRVSVHPSRIHGRGLFALREFREHEMVIEYTGELIRSVVCDARELKYRATDVDCYMFRIDPDWVIDATYAGNAARFINHSCDPNCYAKVVSIDEKKHIVILAQRRIYPGEELTYDYRFPKESEKLPCNCGSYTCRKYLN
ncbi:unnamed protein product [Heterobilharzia americana]|nr:unnamed protein product [Heterobilharzia americana]